MSVISGNLADGKPMQVGGWYNGQQWNGSSLGAPGVENVGANTGKAVSSAVVAQTNPANVNYIQAQQIQAPVSVPYSSGATTQNVAGLNQDVANARSAITESLKTKQAANDAKLADMQAKEQNALKQIGTLTTPFRADLEAAQREKLYINQNFEANQGLVNELDQLLTEGNNAIKQQQEVTGLAAVRNPRIQQTMSDIAARAGVIQAVISARNGQIAQAYTMIDRTSNAIAADRQDQINYYDTIISLNRQDMLSVTDDNKKIAEEKLSLLKNDLARAQDTSDYIKKLMINPETAQLMGDAGVNLNDSVEMINSKLGQATYAREVRDMSNKMATGGYTAVFDPKGVPANQLITVTDSRGQKYYYKKQTTGSGFDTSSFVKQLTEAGMKVSGAGTDTKAPVTTSKVDVNSLWNEVLDPSAGLGSYGGQPNFTPSGGIGTLWKDAQGTNWKFTQKGWVKA